MSEQFDMALSLWFLFVFVLAFSLGWLVSR